MIGRVLARAQVSVASKSSVALSASSRVLRAAVLPRGVAVPINAVSSRCSSFVASCPKTSATQTTKLCSRVTIQISAPARGFASYPEHIKLTMPALSPTMTQGNIVEWKVKEGDKVSPGTAMADVETDKATVAFESVESGYVAKILMPAGSQDVQVNTLVAIIVENPEEVAAFKDYKPEGAAPAKAAPAAAAKPAPAASAAPSAAAPAAAPAAPAASSDAGRVVASPLARNVAAEKGVNLREVAGTGPGGRIIAADIREFQPRAGAAPSAAATAPTAAAPAGWYTDIPHTQVRRVIAKRLLESKQNIPHYYLTSDITMDEVIKLRAQLNATLDDKAKLSVNDFVVKAAALALRKVPQVNSSWMDDAIRQYNFVDVSVAVATPTGLITPIVKDADLKGLSAISADVKRLAAKAKENKLAPDEFQGGTFTISNLGMFGVKSFSAIINPPQACILAVGTAESRVVPNDGKNAAEVPYKTIKVMSVTMSCDHRVVDGAVGAEWLAAFRSYLEKPLSMLL